MKRPQRKPRRKDSAIRNPHSALRSWSMRFASAFNQKGGIPRCEANALGWLAAKAMMKERCFYCEIHPPRRGEKGQGAALCPHCYEDDLTIL